MISLVGIANDTYRFVNLDDFNIIEMTKGELVNYLNNGGKADNIGIKGVNLVGTNGDLRRYKDGIKSNSLVVLYKSIEKAGVFYYVANSLGKVLKLDTDSLIREGRKHDIANGQIAVVGYGKYENVIITSIRGNFREVKEKTYRSLDLDDYIQLYKIYKKINNGVGCPNAVGTVTTDVMPGGVVIERQFVESDFENFIMNYKVLQAFISDKRNYTFEKIYNYYNFKINQSGLLVTVKGIAGYLVTFTKLQKEVFIPVDDTNLVQRLKSTKLNKEKCTNSLEKLFVYGRNEVRADDSVETCDQIHGNFNVDVVNKAKKELKMRGEIEVTINTDYTFNIGSQTGVMMRYNLNVRARDFRGLRGKI